MPEDAPQTEPPRLNSVRLRRAASGDVEALALTRARIEFLRPKLDIMTLLGETLAEVRSITAWMRQFAERAHWRDGKQQVRPSALALFAELYPLVARTHSGEIAARLAASHHMVGLKVALRLNESCLGEQRLVRPDGRATNLVTSAMWRLLYGATGPGEWCRQRRRNFLGVMALLQSHGIGPDTPLDDGTTPLQDVVRQVAMDSALTDRAWDRISLVELLLAAGANPNVSHRGTPLLHQAVTCPLSLRLTVPLLKRGVDLTARDANGDTALAVALRGGRTDTCNLLRKAGAVT